MKTKGVPEAINKSEGHRSLTMKIYLKQIEVNYTKKTRDFYGNLIFEEITKKYPIGYIEHELIYGIDQKGVIYPPKKIEAEFTGECKFTSISEDEYKKAFVMIRYGKYRDWEKQELRIKLRLRILSIMPKIHGMITSEMLEDRIKYSDKWNKVVGRVGFEYSKGLGFMQVVNEIEKKYKNYKY